MERGPFHTSVRRTPVATANARNFGCIRRIDAILANEDRLGVHEVRALAERPSTGCGKPQNSALGQGGYTRGREAVCGAFSTTPGNSVT